MRRSSMFLPSFFKGAKEWTLLASVANPKPRVLERLIFKHRAQNVYLIADAYQGREIGQCTYDFLRFASGSAVERVRVKDGTAEQTLSGGGDLIAYIGYDGLMDFNLAEYPQKSNDRKREAIILACISKSYFESPLRKTGADPLLWTTGLMAPEAYVLKSAIDGWVLNEAGDKIRQRAAEVYQKYQKCGMKGAMRLFASGW